VTQAHKATDADWSWLETVADGICVVDASGIIGGPWAPASPPGDGEHDARVLLDLIVQRLYGISLTLRTVSAGSQEGGARLDRSSDLIDDTIELIRTTSLEPGVPDHALTRAQQEFLRRFPESIGL
jgi:hypothetical protein